VTKKKDFYDWCPADQLIDQPPHKRGVMFWVLHISFWVFGTLLVMYDNMPGR
jgi:hypothetical protein